MSQPPKKAPQVAPEAVDQKNLANTHTQDLLAIGSCGGSEAEIVLADLELLEIKKPEYLEIVENFRNRVRNGTARWSHLYAAQRLRLELLPLERLSGELAELRATFHLVAGKTLREKYRVAAEDFTRDRQNAEQSNDRKLLEGIARAEAVFLLTQTQLIETYRPHQERKRLTIARAILTSAILLVIFYHLFGLAYALVENGNVMAPRNWWETLREAGQTNYPQALVLIATFGAFGAAVSSIIRLQDSFREGRMILNSTRYLRKRLDFYATLISGSIFAILITLIIASGLGETLLKGSLPGQTANFCLNDFFRDGTSGGQQVNLALLLVWAFAAGFAERLVPDTLDRLVGARGSEAKETKT